MTEYVVTYKVTERSVFEAAVFADSEEGALAVFREQVEIVGGYEHLGTWVSTEDTDVDLDSIKVTPA